MRAVEDALRSTALVLEQIHHRHTPTHTYAVEVWHFYNVAGGCLMIVTGRQSHPNIHGIIIAVAGV